MTRLAQNVKKLDIHPIEAIRTALSQGLNRLRIIESQVKINWWRGKIEGSQTTIIVEPNDARH